jgi:hypothetical protein
LRKPSKNLVHFRYELVGVSNMGQIIGAPRIILPSIRARQLTDTMQGKKCSIDIITAVGLPA